MIDTKIQAEHVDAARWRTVVDTARDGIITIDQMGLITFYNAAAESIFGYDQAEVMGQNVTVLMPSPYRDDHDHYLTRYQETGKPKAIGRIRQVHALHKNGRIFPIELSVSEGSVNGERFYAAIVRDVLGIDRRYRLVVDLAAAVILVLSPDLRVLEFNREAERIYGVKRDLVLEKPYLELVPQHSHEHTKAALQDVLAGRELRDFEGRVLSRDGSEPILGWNATRLCDGSGLVTGIIALGQDLTAHRRAEADLLSEQSKVAHAEKMSSVGQLAAGVAHEVNNPLAGVKSLFKALESGRVPDSRRETYVQAIEDGLGRIEQTVRALLDYARPTSSGVGPLDLFEVVSDCLRLIRPAVNKKHLQVDIRFAKGSAMVKGDRHGLIQATMNVLLNATYASPQGGIIAITTAHGEYLELIFEDEGAGIAPENLHRVCDPFFSTKPEGQGTGLGLSVTQSILVRNQGGLVIGNRPEGGARILFKLKKAIPS